MVYGIPYRALLARPAEGCVPWTGPKGVGARHEARGRARVEVNPIYACIDRLVYMYRRE